MADANHLQTLTNKLVVNRNAHLKYDEDKVARAPALVVYEGELEGRKPIFTVGPVTFIRSDVAQALTNGTADDKTVKDFHKHTRPQRRERGQWVGTEAEGKELSNLGNLAFQGAVNATGVGGLVALGSMVGVGVRGVTGFMTTHLQNMDWKVAGETITTSMQGVLDNLKETIDGADFANLQERINLIRNAPTEENINGFFTAINGIADGRPAVRTAIQSFQENSAWAQNLVEPTAQFTQAASIAALPVAGVLAMLRLGVQPILGRGQRIGEGNQLTELLTELSGGERAAMEGDAGTRIADFLRQSSREEGRFVPPVAEKAIAKAAGAIAGLVNKEQGAAVEEKVLKSLGVNAELEQQRNQLRQQLDSPGS
jgi:hypothetical protein